MENKQIDALINLIGMSEQEEAEAYIKGILNGNKLNIDLHIEVNKEQMIKCEIGEVFYLNGKVR